MHKILSDINNPSIGNKAAALLKLDQFNITPDFIVIADDFLKKAFSNNYTESVQYTKIISESIGFLGDSALIVRSSAYNEDSKDKTYAGLFRSEKCNKSTLITTIKAVWDSRLNQNIQIYEKKANSGNQQHTIKMGVIVQKFIEGDFGSVAFTGTLNNNSKWIYIEYAKGGTSDIVAGNNKAYYNLIFLSRHDTIVFSSAELIRDKFIYEFFKLNQEKAMQYLSTIIFTISEDIYANCFSFFMQEVKSPANMSITPCPSENKNNIKIE